MDLENHTGKIYTLIVTEIFILIYIQNLYLLFEKLTYMII